MLYGEIDAKRLKIDKRELAARLCVPISELPAEIDSVVRELAPTANAAYSAVEVDVAADGDTLTLGGFSVASAALSRVLSECTRAVLLTVTLGRGSERFLRGRAAISPSEHFLADAVADAMVEAAADEAERCIFGGAEHTLRFSPGYSDLPLEFVSRIVEMTDAERLLGVTLSRTYLATPSKTVTAIIGIKGDKKE